jgi:hypothetical protein
MANAQDELTSNDGSQRDYEGIGTTKDTDLGRDVASDVHHTIACAMRVLPQARELQDTLSARLTISAPGFSTENIPDLRSRWFGGENDGWSRATTFTRTPVPSTSMSYATGPTLSTALQFGTPAQGRNAGMFRAPSRPQSNPSRRMTSGFKVVICSSSSW